MFAFVIIIPNRINIFNQYFLQYNLAYGNLSLSFLLDPRILRLLRKSSSLLSASSFRLFSFLIKLNIFMRCCYHCKRSRKLSLLNWRLCAAQISATLIHHEIGLKLRQATCCRRWIFFFLQKKFSSITNAIFRHFGIFFSPSSLVSDYIGKVNWSLCDSIRRHSSPRTFHRSLRFVRVKFAVGVLAEANWILLLGSHSSRLSSLRVDSRRMSELISSVI